MNDSFINQKVELKTYNSKKITQYPVAVINSKEGKIIIEKCRRAILK